MSAPAVPGAVRTALLVASKDLRREWRTLDSLSAMGLFSLIVLVLFSFAFDLSTVKDLGVSRLVPGVIWSTLSFAGVVGFTRSFSISYTAFLERPIFPASVSSVNPSSFLLLLIASASISTVCLPFADSTTGTSP